MNLLLLAIKNETQRKGKNRRARPESRALASFLFVRPVRAVYIRSLESEGEVEGKYAGRDHTRGLSARRANNQNRYARV